MKKRVSIILIFTLMMSVWIPECLCISFAASYDVKVMVNGKYVDFSGGYGQPFISDENRTLVPVRGTAEAYGCNVSWDQTKKEVTITYQGHTARIPVDQPYVYTDSGTKVMDTSARIIDGRTYLPIRFAMEAMGAEVSWDNDNHIVLIESPLYVSPLKMLINNLKLNGVYDSECGYAYDVDVKPDLITGLIYNPDEDRVYIVVQTTDSKGKVNTLKVYVDDSFHNYVNYVSVLQESSDNAVWWGRVNKTRYGDMSAYDIDEASGYDDLSRDDLKKLTCNQMEIAVQTFDQFCNQFKFGISSSDFGFYK